jgi:hypothetical protein
MNTVEVLKWFGLTLVCLVMFSGPINRVVLRVAGNFLDRSSQRHLIQEEGDQNDLLLPVRKAAQTATNTSKAQDAYYPMSNRGPRDASGSGLRWPIRPVCR